jgi:Cu(I)/Ag(I) efflux system membrane fusion protein
VNCPICGMKLVLSDEPPGQAQAGQSRFAGAGHGHGHHRSGAATAYRFAHSRGQQGIVSGPGDTVARIEVAPTRVRKTNVKVEGFVERIFVDFVGQSVRKGQPLFSIYSPPAGRAERVPAGAANQGIAGQGRRLGENGEKPGDGGAPAAGIVGRAGAEIDRLTTTREPSKTLTLVSPIAGVVTAKNVVQGARVSPGEAPYEITDLSEVWVMADAYESDLAAFVPGMKATLTLPPIPTAVHRQGVVHRSAARPKTRTVKVHLHFANPKRELKPEMFGEVDAARADGGKDCAFPADAVIRAGHAGRGLSGQRGREVRAARGSAGCQERRRGRGDGGLELGQEVVTRANFLVDSESQLRASLAAIGGK